MLALLDESRTNLAQSRVRLVNQLHALLRDLVASGASHDLSANTAAAVLRKVRPADDGGVSSAQLTVSGSPWTSCSMLLSLVSWPFPAPCSFLVPPLATSSCCPPLSLSVCDVGPPSCWSTLTPLSSEDCASLVSIF